MPKCSTCGNTKSFGISSLPPAAASANGPITGMWADFSKEGDLTAIQSTLADTGDTRPITDNPQLYLDVCMNCGSMDILWP